MNFINEMHSGDTPEEILAGMIALNANIIPRGVLTKHHGRLKGRQFHMISDRVCKGDRYVPIHVSDDDRDECHRKFKAALVEAARELTS